jgi:hypothetical protein
MPHWWYTIQLLQIIGPATTVFGANYDATQDRTHLDMIPHVVELHRVAVDVHALFTTAPHRDRNEMKLLQTTMPPAAARGSVVSTPTAARQRATHLRTRSCRVWSRNLDGDWSNIIFLLPLLLPTKACTPRPARSEGIPSRIEPTQRFYKRVAAGDGASRSCGVARGREICTSFGGNGTRFGRSRRNGRGVEGRCK